MSTKKLVTFNIDADILEEFKKNTNGQKFSHVIEDFMKSVNDEKAKEKELIAPLDKSAISSVNTSQNNNQSTNLLVLNKNQSLDIYLSTKSEINNHISAVNDLTQLREIRDKSKMILTVSDTRLKKLAFTTTIK